MCSFFIFIFSLVSLSAQTEENGFVFKDFAEKTAQPKIIPPDAITARSALLIDAKTGEVLYARNPDEPHLPASTTKLMTGLLVFEAVGFNGNVTVTQDDTKVEPSSVPLIPGETVSVRELFHALLIASDNDAARALARHVAGNDDNFVALMNRRAVTLGCTNTHFANPNGLPVPGGIPAMHTTCSDLMKIFREAMSHPELRRICRTKEYELQTAAGAKILHNHNLLLGRYPGMGPAKTGWTIASRHTYAASATQNGRELMLTILDSPNKWYDAQILFNWGFATLRPEATTQTPTTLPPAAGANNPPIMASDLVAPKPAKPKPIATP